MLQLPLLSYQLSTRQSEKGLQVYDIVRKKWVALTPEEHVRQLLITHFIKAMNYPQALIAVEKKVAVGSKQLRFDIVVYERSGHTPWLLVECKAPDVSISEQTLFQLLHYNHSLGCQYWLVTNGRTHYCANATDTANVLWLAGLPAYNM